MGRKMRNGIEKETGMVRRSSCAGGSSMCCTQHSRAALTPRTVHRTLLGAAVSLHRAIEEEKAGIKCRGNEQR